MIILTGFFISKYDFIPKKIKKKVSLLQNISLIFMLFAMGYKIGSDEVIIGEFSKLGGRGIVITFFSCVMSIVFVHIFYKGDKK